MIAQWLLSNGRMSSAQWHEVVQDWSLARHESLPDLLRRAGLIDSDNEGPLRDWVESYDEAIPEESAASDVTLSLRSAKAAVFFPEEIDLLASTRAWSAAATLRKFTGEKQKTSRPLVDCAVGEFRQSVAQSTRPDRGRREQWRKSLRCRAQLTLSG